MDAPYTSLTRIHGLELGMVMDLNGLEGIRFPTLDVPHPIHPYMQLIITVTVNQLTQQSNGVTPGKCT